MLALYDAEEVFKFWFDRFWTKTRQYDLAESMTPIWLAALSNHDRVLEHFLRKTGINLEAEDEAERTALYFASEQGHEKVVQMLLDRCADVNVQGGQYGNALYVALTSGHEKIGEYYSKALQAASASSDDKIVETYGRALQAASYSGCGKVVQMLLDRGAEVNVRREHYDNALYEALRRGHGKIVRMLLDRGADINI
ncbi:hypothetical protein KCU92_g7143, partial [Aureobasidium melanogenum]